MITKKNLQREYKNAIQIYKNKKAGFDQAKQDLQQAHENLLNWTRQDHQPNHQPDHIS